MISFAFKQEKSEPVSEPKQEKLARFTKRVKAENPETYYGVNEGSSAVIMAPYEPAAEYGNRGSHGSDVGVAPARQGED